MRVEQVRCPLQSFRPSPGRHASIAGSAHPLLGFCSLSEYLKRRYLAHWLRNPSSPFTRDSEAGLELEVFAPLLVCRSFFRQRTSLRVAIPFRVSPGVPARPSKPRVRPLSWGSLPFGACGSLEPTSPGLTSPGTLRSQVFSTSQRFASPDAFRPCFMPVTPMGFRPSELSPRFQPRTPSRGLMPSCR